MLRNVLGGVYYAALGLFAIAAALVLSAALPAKAYAGSPWTGCYAGIGGAYGSALTDTSLNVTSKTTTGAIIDVDSFGAEGAGIFGTVGCDMQVPNSKFVVGVFGDYQWFNDTTWTVGLPLLTPKALAEMSLDSTWAVGGRAGYLLTPDVMLYGLAGYTQANTSDLSSPLLGGSLAVPNLKGYELGAGTEVALGKGFFVQAQYVWANYDAESINIASSPKGSLDLGLDTTVQTARLGLTYKFGGSDVTAPFEGKPLK